MSDRTLIHDWNQNHANPWSQQHRVEICDETLRDGIQSPSVYDPSIAEKLELIELMNRVGITIANIGLPGAGPRAQSDAFSIAQYVRDQRLKLKVNCAARTVIADIEPIAAIQQKVGIPITAYCFLGASPIRQLVEDWHLDHLKRTSEAALTFAQKAGLATAFVTEDTTRSSPETLRILFRHAISLGIERLVLCDTVGHATPHGIKALVDFTKNVIAESNTDIKIDWHGHNDRGLAVANAIFAAEYGCDRIHGTALGVGERIGNTSADQLIVNLKLLVAYPHNVSDLAHYVEKSAAYLRVPLPYNYPVFGHDAFRTATGVHAAAVIKALKKGDDTLANTIYSGVPAHWFGKRQIIEIGPLSGASNVRHWLLENNHLPTDQLVKALLNYAKSQSQTLTNQEIHNFISQLNGLA
jgi:2-isopropylmalate synthase